MNLNPTPVRPMIRIDDDDGAHIYAANIPNNTIGRFDGGPTAGQTFRTLVSPVALAYDAKRDLLLVVAQHSDAVVAHDRTTGVIRKVIGVPNEPADIVIVGRSAFVSSNAVQRAPLGYGPRG